MSRSVHPLERLRSICLALPESREVTTWGHPTFRVQEKIFCSFSQHDGSPCATFKVGTQMQGVFLDDPRFFKPDYVGRYGWVGMRLHGSTGWEEVAELVLQSYLQIAPARLRKAAG